MRIQKKHFTKLFLTTVFFVFVSCASVPVREKARVTKTPHRMFWRIDGTDLKGRNTTVYVQGTIHIGDDRLLPLDEEVIAAFDSSDRIVAECSSRDFNRMGFYSLRLVRPNEDGKVVTDYLTDAENIALHEYIGGEPGYENLIRMNPLILESYLTVKVASEFGLDSEAGLDMFFYDRARKNGKSVEGLDELEDQLKLLSFGDYEFQMAVLKYFLTGLSEGESEQLADMYEAYLDDDLEVFLEEAEKESEEEVIDSPYYEQYEKAMMLDRNTDWVKDIKKYLDAGGTTFIFTGAAHWLGEESVFELLKADGVIEK